MKKISHLKAILTITAIMLALLGLERVNMTEPFAAIILIVVIFVWVAIAIYKDSKVV